jgi:plasmid stabilization system protein ParE
MKSGYEIIWTNHAINELAYTIENLENKWTEKELRKFSAALNHVIEIISKNPLIFQKSSLKKGVRRAEIDKLNTLYYRITKNTIEILSRFSIR